MEGGHRGKDILSENWGATEKMAYDEKTKKKTSAGWAES